MAMPMVAGVVSSMLSMNPGLTESQITTALSSTVIKNITGGTTNPWDNKIKWEGRLDAAAALKYVADNYCPFTKTILGDVGGNPFER
ncbi:MAG: hypothetical protein KatS3mg082_3153 [Nitrospiraceae bacterium]|nr:MAG: hypothetical protein KatS3mg082_3153 [Nitrospiraceae bacterium]